MTLNEILENIKNHAFKIMDMEDFETGIIRYEDEFGTMCERNILQETRNELYDLFVQLGKEEGFVRFMTPEEKEINEKMLKGINKSICFEAAFQVELEMRRKEAHDMSLTDVERACADELAEEAFDKLNQAENRTAKFKETYYEFARSIKDRVDSELEDAYHRYLSLMYSGEKFDPSVDHNQFSLSIKGEIWDCEFTKN